MYLVYIHFYTMTKLHTSSLMTTLSLNCEVNVTRVSERLHAVRAHESSKVLQNLFP